MELPATPISVLVFIERLKSRMNYLSQEDFLKLTAKGNLIPVYREIAGDLETPV